MKIIIFILITIILTINQINYAKNSINSVCKKNYHPKFKFQTLQKKSNYGILIF